MTLVTATLGEGTELHRVALESQPERVCSARISPSHDADGCIPSDVGRQRSVVSSPRLTVKPSNARGAEEFTDAESHGHRDRSSGNQPDHGWAPSRAAEVGTQRTRQGQC